MRQKKITHRFFLTGAILLFLAGFVIQAQVPEYYKQHLSTKITLINDHEKNIGALGDVFVYITDTHTASNKMTSTYLIKDVCTKTSADKVIFGGDMVVAFGGEQKMYDCVLKHMNSFDAVVSPCARLYNLIGNHDIIIKDTLEPKNPVSYTATDAARYALIMKRQESYVNFDPQNPHGCYYYFDNEVQKIRYICLNGFERHSDSKTTWTDIRGISPTQAIWLIETALQLPDDDWNVFVFSHSGIVEASYPGGFKQFSVAKDIFEAYNTSSTYKFEGEAEGYQYDLKADFTKNQGRLIAVFSGHTHKDLMGYSGGVPHITTASDAYYSDAGIRRTVGTVNESCFDVVCYDKPAGLLSLVRIGAGYDRLIHLGEPTRLSVNQSLEIKPTLKAVDWGMSDLSVATIDNGTVTAIKKGEVTVTAMDEFNNKEFFSLIISP